MKLSKDWREFVESLNSNGVDYLVVGGFAVAWHGHPRFTADIDFLIRPTAGNADAECLPRCGNSALGASTFPATT